MGKSSTFGWGRCACGKAQATFGEISNNMGYRALFDVAFRQFTPARMVCLCSGYVTFASFNHFVLWFMGMSCNDSILLMHCVN